MDNRAEIREFLASRRAKVTPAEAGLPIVGGTRRVKGLRREEVALLSGVSVDYYNRLERGNLGGASESVLESLASALRLDDAERAYLHYLARNADATPKPRRRRTTEGVRPGIRQILEAIENVPAHVRNGRRDILAGNRLGNALYSEVIADSGTPPNVARFTFLSPRAQAFFPEWDRAANDTVASLRIEAGRNPYDRELSDLVGELSTRSEEFRVRWAAHNVRHHYAGRKHIHHPAVGELHLTFESMELPADPGLTLIIYNAEPGSPSHDGLKMLASWAATMDQPLSSREFEASE